MREVIGPINGLGTQWWFEFFDDLEDKDELADVLQNIITAYNDAYSRFDDSSYVGRLNNGEEIERGNDTNELEHVLSYALKTYHETAGVFNITAGAELVQRGYGSTETEAVMSDPADSITISDNAISVTDDTHIDFGGFGKGWLIDKIATFLQAQGYEHFIVNGGGDIFVTSDHGMPVEIQLQHPLQSEKSIGSLFLKDQGFAASSPFVRTWEDDQGNSQHHLVGEIARAAFIVANSAVQADTWATVVAMSRREEIFPGDIAIAYVQENQLVCDQQFTQFMDDNPHGKTQ